MNDGFAVPEFEAATCCWLIGLVQKHPPDVPKYFTGTVAERWLGGITTQAKNALRYSTEEGAAQHAARVPPHPWGQWKAVEYRV